jgi:hypothetical protein
MANSANLSGSVVSREELIDLKEQIRRFNSNATVGTPADLNGLLAAAWTFITTPRHLLVAAVAAAGTAYYILNRDMPELIIIK